MSIFRRTVVSAAVPLAATLLVTGCQFSASIGGGLDVEELERQIVAIGDEQRADLAPWSASCPEAPDELPAGTTFFCTATDADGTEYEVTVTATDDDGNVDISF